MENLCFYIIKKQFYAENCIKLCKEQNTDTQESAVTPVKLLTTVKGYQLKSKVNLFCSFLEVTVDQNYLSVYICCIFVQLTLSPSSAQLITLAFLMSCCLDQSYLC